MSESASANYIPCQDGHQFTVGGFMAEIPEGYPCECGEVKFASSTFQHWCRAEADLTSSHSLIRELVEAVEGAANRMERARVILQERDSGNWGMLDTKGLRALISRAKATIGDST